MSDEKVYIYHTNDIHSNLTYWPRIANELQEKRAIREEHGDFVLAFDMGDASDRVHPLTEATDGQAISELLNDGQYDAAWNKHCCIADHIPDHIPDTAILKKMNQRYQIDA